MCVDTNAGQPNQPGQPEHPVRRKAPRAPVEYDLHVDVLGDHVPYTGMIKDISSGGLFISTRKHHRVGDKLQVRFTFPTVKDPVEAECEVRWVRDYNSAGGLPPGVGVQFTGLSPEIVQKINCYIKDKDVPFYEEGF
jgi:uncharacterized protein (TIGR02266 family)